MRARTLRCALPAVLASLVPFVSATAAQADLLTEGAQNCTSNALSQTFLPWGDVANYVPAPGGNFADGSPSWSLSDGAAVVDGGDGFSLNGAAPSDNSLSLPAGSSATSAATCVGIANPDIRYFARNTGDPTSTLQVSVNFVDALGVEHTAVIGQIAANGTWAPTLQDPIIVNLLPILPGAMTPVSFNFTPQGAGNWQIDDLWVDPWGRT